MRAQFETNVFGTHELTCLLLPTLRKQNDARIVQNSSVLGVVAALNRGAYSASKFALEAISDTLRLELAHTSVKVILLEPGPIISKFRENALVHFSTEIDVDSSFYQPMYQRAKKRLQTKGAAMSFTLEPSAVVDKLMLALEKPNPKARYRITTPTHLVALLKRFLSSKMIDKFMLKYASP